MLRIKLFIIFFLLNFICFGQDYSDLNKSFKTASDLSRTHPDSALIMSGKLDSVLDKTQNISLKYKVYMLRGDIFLTKKENEQALEAYQKMNFAHTNDTIAQLQALRISRYYRNIGEYPKALEYALQNLDFTKRLEDDSKLSGAHGNLASIYNRLDQNEKALEQEQKRIKISKRSDYTRGVFLGYYNSSQYIDNSKIEERIQLLNIADSINENHLNNNYFSQVINLNLGESLYKTNRFDDAFETLDKVKDQYLNTKNVNTKLYFLQVYVQVLNSLKRHSEAKKYIALGLASSKESNSLQHEEEFLKELEYTHTLEGDFKSAYFESKNRFKVNDSLRNISVLKEIEELNAKFELAEKESKLAQSTLEINKKTNQRNIAIAFVGIISFLTFYLWRRNKYKQELSIQNIALQNKKLESLEHEKRLDTLSAMLEGQEEERKRIAQDLHDGLGGLLSSAKSHISVVQDSIIQLENMNISKKATEMIDEAVVEVRRISQNLMPSSLRLRGLSDAITNLCQDLTQVSEIQFSFEYKNTEHIKLNDKISLSLFRIVQEASNNALRHSEAKEVLIQLSVFGNEVSLMIEDDGKGFDLKQKYNGFGLHSFKARTDQLNGMLDIDSIPGKGTTLTINIPI